MQSSPPTLIRLQGRALWSEQNRFDQLHSHVDGLTLETWLPCDPTPPCHHTR